MAPAITGVFMKPTPIAGTETMFCKDDIIDATEPKHQNPPLQPDQSAITAGYVKVSKRVKS